MIPLRDSVPSRRFPFVNYLLIGSNALVFLHQLQLASQNLLEPFISRFAMTPALFVGNPAQYWPTLFTSQFLHGGWMHLIGNMLYLYIFGDNVEDKFGHVGYLIFYLLSGAAAAFGQIYFSPGSHLPMLGASGAISGVMGAYFFYYPGATVLTLVPIWFFIRIIEIPAFFFLGFWFLMQFFSGTMATHMAQVSGKEIGGVAFWAHAWGFIAGLVSAILLKVASWL